MGVDDTLTSHIELVCDSFDMACQSAIYTHIALEWMPCAYHPAAGDVMLKNKGIMRPVMGGCDEKTNMIP